MYAFQIGDLEQVMNIPVPIRKWLIQRWNKQKDREQKAANGDPGSDVSKPLSDAERMKFLKKSQEATNKPNPPSPQSFMQGMRNRK